MGESVRSPRAFVALGFALYHWVFAVHPVSGLLGWLRL